MPFDFAFFFLHGVSFDGEQWKKKTFHHIILGFDLVITKNLMHSLVTQYRSLQNIYGGRLWLGCLLAV